jgi:hypothetical protein
MLLIILFITHAIVCGVIGYRFQVRSVIQQQTFTPPIEITTMEEHHRSERSFLMEEEHYQVTFPKAVVGYALLGFAALAIAFGIQLYQRFGAHA